MPQLEGRVALVTGASRGIGAAIAKRFAAEGASVAVTARTLEPHPKLPGTLLETVDWIEQHGGEAVAIQADLANPASWPKVVEHATRELGDVEILVNNAAAAFYAPLPAVSEKHFRLSWELNLHAPWELTQLVYPGMRERGDGWILNVSSATSHHPIGPPFDDFSKTSTLYGATKAALERFTTGAAASLADDRIRVNSLAPVGAVMTEGAVALGVVPDDFAAEAESLEAMAEAALALCSGDDPTLTGRITYCSPILAELGRRVRTLDGKETLDGPRADQAPRP